MVLQVSEVCAVCRGQLCGMSCSSREAPTCGCWGPMRCFGWHGCTGWCRGLAPPKGPASALRCWRFTGACSATVACSFNCRRSNVIGNPGAWVRQLPRGQPLLCAPGSLQVPARQQLSVQSVVDDRCNWESWYPNEIPLLSTTCTDYAIRKLYSQRSLIQVVRSACNARLPAICYRYSRCLSHPRR